MKGVEIIDLKDLRNDLGLTQQDIANTLQCTQTKVSDIERKRRKLQIDDLAKLIKAYDIKTDVLRDIILDQEENK